jgi:DNA-binding Xre family transcriptional regulator
MLSALLDQRQGDRAELASAIGRAIDETWLADAPPGDLTMGDLAALCAALRCQPGDLLAFAPEDPADQAALDLSGNQFYQSFLAHRANLESAEAEDPDDD